jgi:trehalose 6-phosphate phosphatase
LAVAVDFRTDEGQDRYDGLVARARDVVVGLDFDGTLSPIVSDPARARIHPSAPDALTALAPVVRAVVVVTGRPARQVVELGHLDEVADALPDGATLRVQGQYGNEHWDASSRAFTSEEPPPGLQSFRDELPALLEAADAADARVEEKGLAVAVHVRTLPDAREAFDRLVDRLGEAAERHGLGLEPGRMVLEVRAPGMHKGLAIGSVLDELGAGGVMFVGDDLGDVQAFEEVGSRRDDQGLPALLVCSSSDEEEALSELADLVVGGPEGVVDLLRRFTAAAS